MAVLKNKKGDEAEVKAEKAVTEEVQEKEVETKAAKPAETTKEEAPKPSFFVYIGPSIRGQIQYGALYQGSRAEVEKLLERQIAKYPRIKALLISDLRIVEDRVEVKKPGTRLYNEYKRLVSELK